MGRKLIITEKPSVARDFARVLGVNSKKDGFIENGEYVITWCVGHLVEMLYPESYDPKYKKWTLKDLPFLPENYKYGVIENVAKQYNIVHTFLTSEEIDVVYWAGDSGKEGQTIEENIRNFGGVRKGMTELRVWIDSQTDEEILRGIREAKPMSDYARLGDSGIMRSIEDYALGINFSRVLSVKYGTLLNKAAATKSYTAIAVGRVMTCVLGMVVIREREIRNFVETPFYRCMGLFTEDKLPAEWKVQEKSVYYNSPLLYKENGFKKEESAKQLIASCEGKPAFVENIEKGTSKKKPPLLFNLAEIQAECAKLFKISPDETLQVVQDLYERKLTTYPRTDARVLTTAVAKEIDKTISKLKGYEPVAKYADKIMSDGLYKGIEKTQYTDDSKVTDHYCIIPTGQLPSGLNDLHQKVYDLIVRRFLSIFYPPAEYLNLKMTIKIEEEYFYMSSKILQKKGYLEIAGTPRNKEGNDSDGEISSSDSGKLLELVKKMKKGDEIDVNSFEIKEGKTSPPKRYTSGTMILAMENAGNLIEDEELRAQIKNTGIGTSATRAEIIKKLINNKYLKLNAKTQVLTPENLGEMIYEVVYYNVPTLLNPQMTASWEKGLDGITRGTVDLAEYRAKLEEYIRSETQSMIENNMTETIAKEIAPYAAGGTPGFAPNITLDLVCPMCGGNLQTTSFGYGCKNYFDESIKCSFHLGQISGVTIPLEQFRKLMTEGKTDVINGFTSKSKKKFNASLKAVLDENGKMTLRKDMPDIEFDFSDVIPEYLEEVTCPDCGGKLRETSFGYGCANYNAEEDSAKCTFAVGTIAGKKLKKDQVIALIKDGRTEKISGFKSKAGKRFEAVLLLEKDEDGRSKVRFEFDNTEEMCGENIICPNCSGRICKTGYGYRCENHTKEADSCPFFLPKIASRLLSEEELQQFLSQEITDTISGFVSKGGKKFEAKLKKKIDEAGKVTGAEFVFENTDQQPVQLVEGAVCPVCGGRIFKKENMYYCEAFYAEPKCRFSLPKVCGVLITEEQLGKLVDTGRTDVIEGFLSKKGNPFAAMVTLDKDEEGNIKGFKFEFPEKKEENE